MSNQLVITSGAKVRNLSGVLTGTSGVVSSVPYGGANGVATLDGSGKVPLSQLPASVITYLGTWNAATNTPTLTNGVGDTGDLYICNVAGTVNFGAGPITFAVGDWVIYSGTTWEKSGGASGTVTSVAMTVPTGLSVTGSPITTSGTLAVDLASGYTIPTTSFLSGLVPYTGAIGNVNLGEYGLSGGYLGLDTTPTGTPTTLGTLSWDDTYLTPKVITGTGATTLQVGQEEVVLVHNNTGSTLTDGQVVYINGSTGNLPTVALADASSETTSAATLGVVTETIANGSNGFITISGNVNGLNTLGYTAGDILWLSETAGQFTNVKPISPAHLVLIGYVVKVSGGNGSILVKIQNTQELEECSDVLFTSLANNDILAYESSTDLWKNKTIANVLGYTPANAADYVPYTGATSSLNLGNYGLTAASIVVASTGTNAGQILLKQGSVFTTPDGYGTFGSGNANNFYFYQTSSSVTRGARLSLAYITGGATRTYTLQDADGTLAFTSDIPSLTNYVTLTGAQTITGIKTFTNEQLFGNGITLTGGYITYTSGSFNLTLNTNILTANRNVFIKDGSGTLAFTSDIPSLSGYVQGSGTTNYHAKFTASSTIGNSMLTDDGTTLQSIGATRSNLYLKAASSSYYSQLAFTNGSNGSFGGISYNNSGQYMQIEANSSEWLRLYGNGNLRLFSSSATDNGSKFQVEGSATFAGSVKSDGVSSEGKFIIERDSVATNTIIGSLDFTNNNAATTYGKVFGGRNSAGDGYVALGTGVSNNLYALETGNVGIGTSSPTAALQIAGVSQKIYSNNETTGYAYFQLDNTGGSLTMGIERSTGGGLANGTSAYSGYIGTNNATALVFGTNVTERMRIGSNGNVLVGTSTDTNSGKLVGSQSANNWTIYAKNTASSGSTFAFLAEFTAQSPNNTTSYFYYGGDTTTQRFSVRGNGGIYNFSANNSNLSDARLKKDIFPLESYWDKFKAIEIVKFKYIDQTHDDFNIGVIAQQVEQVAPEFIDADGWDDKNIPEDGIPIKSVYEADLHHATIKVLQEAMAKIEELEAKVSALENK
jgi:hypothetical protein